MDVEGGEEHPRGLFGNWRQKHTVAYLWDNFASGMVLSTVTFLNLALLKLGTIAAGCPGQCRNQIYISILRDFILYFLTVVSCIRS